MAAKQIKDDPDREKSPAASRGRWFRILRAIWAPFRFVFRALVDQTRSRSQRVAIALGGAAGMTSLGFGALLLYLLILVPFTPSKNQIREAATQRASVIVDSNGEQITRFDRAHRVWVGLDDISPSVVDALVATEDHRFYEHNGIDRRRLASSVVHTILGNTQGGSTITMQLARNLYPDEIGKAFGPNRKCKELVTARKIESVYSKDEIIELYLNTVPFLYGVRGIEMAAQTYFRKSADALDLNESATLIGMLKATSYYNPVRHPERSAQRRNVVVGQMLKRGAVDSSAAVAISKAPVRTRFTRPRRSGAKAPHFSDRVEREAATWARRNGYDLYADGLTIHASLDLSLQRLAETAVRRQGDALQRVANVEWSRRDARLYSTDIRNYAARDRSSAAFEYFWDTRTDLVDQFIRESAAYKSLIDEGADEPESLRRVRQDDGAMSAIRKTKTRLEAGFVAIDPRNGFVRAWVGSRDYVTAPFDHVASSRRQPGSTFKPVVYAAALESGYTPDDVVRNEAVEIRSAGADVWRLASARDATEFISLREGLAKSHNNVAAQLIQEVGPRKTAAMAERLGVRDSELNEVPSLALGTSPVSLLEMASVYATIAGEGLYNEPVFISAITEAGGRTIYEHEPNPQRVMSAESAIYLADMLRDVVDYGTGQRIRYQFGVRGDVGGKTGTTQNNMDGWFMTIHPHLTTGAWVGFDDPRVTFRTDFWGEGAHNALFIVGDVLRQAVASGQLNTRVRFADPPPPIEHLQFADRASNWVSSRFGRIAEAFRKNRDAPSRPQIRPDWIADESASRERRVPRNSAGNRVRTERRSDRPRAAPGISELTSRLKDYEQLKERIAEGLESLRDGDSADGLLDAYRRERESNPDLEALERELEVRIRRWIDAAERRIAESEDR